MEQTRVNNLIAQGTLINQNMISNININSINNVHQINQQQQQQQQVQQTQLTQNHNNLSDLDPNDYTQILKIFEKYNLKVFYFKFLI
jgi:hypothetical protein